MQASVLRMVLKVRSVTRKTDVVVPIVCIRRKFLLDLVPIASFKTKFSR